jgi:tetratricopeptide (TPR) repeat protein/DNA-binding CsgD family transcriptional regulator
MGLVKRKSLVLFCFVYMLVVYSAYSENYHQIIDSLKKVNLVQGISKTKKARTLYNLSWYYYNSQLYDSAIIYSRQAFLYSINNSVDTVVHKSVVMLGAMFTTKSEYDSAAFYLLKGAIYFEPPSKTMYKTDVAKIHSLLANVFSEQSKYDEAYIYYDKSEATFIKVKDTTSWIFNIIAKGNMFTNIQLYDKALTEYNNATRLSKQIGKSSNLGYLYNNISTVYKKIGDKAKAKNYLFKAINAYPSNSGANILADAYHNLSILYNSQNMYDSAVYYNGLALEIFKYLKLSYRENVVRLWQCEFYLSSGRLDTVQICLDSIYGIQKELYAKYYLLYSKLEYKKNRFDSSVKYAQKALLVAKQNKDIEEQKNCFDMLYKANKDKGDLFSALKAHENYYLLKDSAFNQEKSIAVQKVIVENVIREKNEEIESAELEHQKKQARKNKIIWITVIIITGLILVVTIIYLMLKNQKQKAKISKTKFMLLKKEAEEVKRELELQLLKKEADKIKQEFEMELLKKETAEIKKEIIDFSLQSIKNKEFIELIQNKLKTIRQSSSFDSDSINNLYALTTQFLLNEQERVDFQQRVEEIQKSFFEKLDRITLQNDGKLTKTEKKLAALLKMKLSSKEIGSILNVEEKSVEIYRSRLRKKLNIDVGTTLTDFLNNT